MASVFLALDCRLLRSRARGWLVTLIAGIALLGSTIARAQLVTGAIEGRVQNVANGTYINNARVAIEGTTLESFTNQEGEYRLPSVPAGTATVRVTYAGLETQSVRVAVEAGRTARQEFNLGLTREQTETAKNIVKLDAYVVEAKELSAQASAINEQRAAPNIKNVVAFEEFGNMSDGNVGEYLKYTPGLSITYGPQTAQLMSIRGMPPNATLVTVDGAELSSPAEDRAFDLATSAAGNVDRVEVTKVPTPDMPANAVGGMVNIIGKSGFSAARRKVSVNVYGTYASFEGLKPPGLNTPGSDRGTDRKRIQPGYDLSYVEPLNKSLAFTFNLSGSTRYYEINHHLPTWNLASLTQTRVDLEHVLQAIERQSAAATIDWKISRNNSLRFSYQHVQQNADTRQHNFIALFGAGAVGGPTFTRGAATGVDTIRQNPIWGDRTRGTDVGTLRFQHTGNVWRFDANGSVSKSWDERLDIEKGFFRNVANPQRANVILRADQLEAIYDGRLPTITATDRAGVPIDPFASDDLTVASATSMPYLIKSDVQQAMANLARDFAGPMPFTLKTGVSVNRQLKTSTSPETTWSFNPPGGAAGRLARNFDFVKDDYASQNLYYDSLRVSWLSNEKVFELFQEHPEYFTKNEAAAYTSLVVNSTKLRETVSAAYLRGDTKLFDNKLWLVGGVRFEQTRDHGLGPLNDVRAIYEQDANGNLRRDAGGRLIRVTTDALATAKLQYTELGAEAKRTYDGYYPSVNASYYFSDALVARVAFARTIGRPALAEIIPGITVTDPDAASGQRTITVVNTGLKPWTSNNYDLSLEAYNFKGAVISASLFRKDIKDFFGALRVPATVELLEEYGLSDDYLDYEVITKQNFGEAAVTGVELSWRQTLFFLPAWAQGFQTFANVTKLKRTGANASDFSSFSAFNANGGVSYVRKNISVKVNLAYAGEVKGNRLATNASTPPESFQNVAPKSTLDVYAEYRFLKRFSIYTSISNLTGQPKRTYRYAPDTPDYAKPFRYQDFGTLVTVGMRVDF